MKVFIKNISKSNFVSKISKTKTSCGVWIDIKDEKNKKEFSRLAKHIFRVQKEGNYEATVVMSPQFVAFKESKVEIYNTGMFYFEKRELKGKREEI